MTKTKESQETTGQTTQAGGGSNQQSAQQAPQTTQSTGGEGSGQGQQTGLSRRPSSSPTLFASPFTLMRLFTEEMDRLFSTDFSQGRGTLAPRGTGEISAWSPHVEVFEREGQLVVRADLPGMDKDDVQVEIDDDAIILRGERRQEHKEERGGVYRTEVSYGSFYREIPLPEGVNADSATATFRNGVLEITMPAPQREKRSRQLEIKDATQAGENAGARTQTAGAKS